jgi:hypothetical protein
MASALCISILKPEGNPKERGNYFPFFNFSFIPFFVYTQAQPDYYLHALYPVAPESLN